MSAPAEGKVAGRGTTATIVEFCGLPGAGKSYIADHVLSTLSDHGVVARLSDDGIGPDVAGPRRIARKLRWVLEQEVTRPTASMRVLGCIGAGQRDWSSAISRSVQWFVTQGLLDAASRTAGVHLFQEGVLQALWSMGLRGELRRLLRLLDDGAVPWTRPNLVVVVDASTEAVRRRLLARHSRHSRTQELQGAELDVELRRGADLLTQLVGWWEHIGGRDRLLRVSNDSDERPVVGEVVGFIEARRST